MSPLARLRLSLALVTGVAVLELWGGFRANSIALLTDAVHVCMDVFALAVALFAASSALRPPNNRKTFGYGRMEILGAFFNGTVLLALTAFLVFQAIERFFTPVHSQGIVMSAVAGAALIVNASIALMLRGQGRRDLNLRAALFHVAGDAFGSLAVVIGGIGVMYAAATWIDPLLSMFVAGIILIGVYRVVRDAADVLLEGVPAGMHIDDVRATVSMLPGVVSMHDVHVWAISSGALALSAHVQVEDRRVSEATAIARTIDTVLRERFSITHVTLQFECENCAEDERVVCTQKRVEL